MTTALEGGEGSASRPGRSLPPGKTRYPLYRRLGGPQGRSGQVQKIWPLPVFNPRTVQPVASRYTDWATRPTNTAVLQAVYKGRQNWRQKYTTLKEMQRQIYSVIYLILIELYQPIYFALNKLNPIIILNTFNFKSTNVYIYVYIYIYVYWYTC